MKPDLKVLEAAATWYVQLGAHPERADQHLAWQRWLEADPAHRQAWARVEKLQNQWSALPDGMAAPTLAGARSRRRSVLKTLALLLAAGGSGWLVKEQVPYQAMLAQVRTGVGERRQLHLADGSQLTLNTSSAVDIAYNPRARRIQLHQGEIMLHTAQDRQRPLLVETRHGHVSSRSGQFSVRCDAERTRVCALAGNLQVQPLQSSAFELQSGQQASFDTRHSDPASPLRVGEGAWVDGMLTVVDWPLGEFIAELGRYRPGVVRCDPAVAHLSLSGAFNVDHSDVLLENLGKSLPVQVRYLTRYWVSIEAA